MPYELDLQGEEALQARRFHDRIHFDYPGFEVEAGRFTLHEIQERAKHFDPLGFEVGSEVRAISANAWTSLGRKGLALHFQKASGVYCEVLVLVAGQRGKRWEVSFDGRVVARFSTVEQAVEAVDYEVDMLGAQASARPEAPWRKRSPAPNAPGWRGRLPSNQHEALQLALFGRLVDAGRRG
jgi:hypothetical protein